MVIRPRAGSGAHLGGGPPPGVAGAQATGSYTIAVRVPYRLDLTVSALRRLPTNPVDVLSPGGAYVRVLDGMGSAALRVEQVDARRLVVEIDGDRREHRRLLALVRRMLGVEVDLGRFNRSASRIPWLRPLARRMRGVKPPRYPTLWEACVNAIVFQQVSVIAASAIMRRFVATLGKPRERFGARLYAFPDPASVRNARAARLRAAGLSDGKLATLRRVADALDTGSLDEAALEQRPSPEAAALLCGIKGIGPWTAAVVLLRGLGRLDVFPANDSGVARNLAMLVAATPLEVEAVLETLGPQRGMLYYHLLLARLEARSELGRPSHDARA
ncbi:MAG: DNA-3-methyladenine glycosylase 2 family protein [Burkholderiales bacterium]|nr:DNA-3-methyladenine glycosylase 2 family protein [Burkholderiales bacterium]